MTSFISEQWGIVIGALILAAAWILTTWVDRIWCHHRWVAVSRSPVVDPSIDAAVPVGHLHLLRCSACGEMKTFSERFKR